MRFVINDETAVNIYGFRVLTSGIKLGRFKDNPVCLNNHSYQTQDVLGIWENLTVERGKLTGSVVFDTQSETGKEVERQVNNGTIKGCSMGLSFSPDKMIFNENGETILTECELLEVSICAVPANPNTVKLYHLSGEEVSEKEFKTIQLSLKNKNNDRMKLLTDYLQLSGESSEVAVLDAIKSIELKLAKSEEANQELKAENETLKNAEVERLRAVLSAEVDKAVKEGRLDRSGAEPILSMDYESAIKVLSALPKRKTISEQLSSPESELEKYDKMSWHELDKGNHLAKLKANYPDYFMERKKKEFNK